MTSRNGIIPDQLELGGGTMLYRFSVDQSSYLLVRGTHSLLINCHSSKLYKTLEYRRLPLPELILHTHVKPETCREGDTFPDAVIRVPSGLEELAADPDAWHTKAHTVWEDPMAWGDTMGAEAYGVAGCITQFPPDVPLQIGPSIKAGDSIEWQGLTLDAISLPFSGGIHALGFILRREHEILAIFIGDLFRDEAVLVNMIDLERTYGGTCLAEMPPVLRDLAEAGTDLFCPSTGPMLLNGPQQARNLAAKIEAYQEALRWESPDFIPEPPPNCPTLGRYCVVHRGVYQFQAPGNPIFLIDDEGHGLAIDPGPCDYDQPMEERQRRFDDDLALFEREAGLKTIDLILVTHHHGDHYDLAPVILDRYPDCQVGAWDLVARVLRAPWDFPYCCTLPWYNLGFEHVEIQLALALHEPFYWHDIRIDSIHLPGHSYCHGGYLLTFNGKRLAITGDSIQNQHGDAVGLTFIMGNHSVPGQQGCLAAFQRMARETVDLNLGGHGSRFTQCAAVYAETVRRIEHATPYLAALIPHGDFQRAFFRPGFPRMDTFG